MRLEELKIKEEYKKLLHPLTEEQYFALKESIKEKGILQDLIINPEKVILDGHHRYKIAKELKIKEVPVKIRSFEDPLDEVEFVLTINFKRRHSNTYQRGKAALKFLEIEKERAKQRQGTRTDLGKTLASREAEVGKASEIAAKKFGLAHATLERIEKIEKEAPEGIKKLCEAEALGIRPAYNIVRAFSERRIHSSRSN